MSFHGGGDGDAAYRGDSLGLSEGAVREPQLGLGGVAHRQAYDEDEMDVHRYLGDGLDVRESSIGHMANEQEYDSVTGGVQSLVLRDKYNQVMRSTLCLYLYVVPIVVSMVALFAYMVGAHCGFWLFAEGVVTLSIVLEIGFGFYVLRGEMLQSLWRVVDLVVGLLCLTLFLVTTGSGCSEELDALETILIVVRYSAWSVRLFRVLKDRKDFINQGEVTLDERFDSADNFGL